MTAITRTELPNGKLRYEVDGEIHTKASNRVYDFASVYRREVVNYEYDRQNGIKPGDLVVFLHSRRDLAAKGHQVGEANVKAGYWTRVGVVEIVEK
jgi:spore maturation protein CgeB